MSDPRLNTALQGLGVSEYVDRAAQNTLAREIAYFTTDDIKQPNPEKLLRLGFVYETQGLAAFKTWITRRTETKLQEEVRNYFLKAFNCWRAIVTLPSNDLADFSNTNVSPVGIQLIRAELIGDPLPPELMLAFRLSVSGLLSTRTAETRLELQRFRLVASASPTNWSERVIEQVISAFARLVRKANGWDDIDQALNSINQLRQLQQEYEETYLNDKGNESEQAIAAAELVGLYHLAQLVTIVGEYLRDGNDSATQINLRLERHRERAITAFQAGRTQTILSHMTDLLWAGCHDLVQNSIWTHVTSLGEAAREFARLLVERGRPNPVLELWPSQQEALHRNLLDPYRRAVLVEMPTSAGKTLLAKFAIVQAKALNPNATIAYIVPTRALVNQVTLDLRTDFHSLRNHIRVEQAVPAFELDPVEERLLNNSPDVLVTTPEKLDLLIRKDHPATRDIAMVIADEAHNIREERRGPRLELLLGTIKRDRAGARFLLLSPFLPNDQELVSWLGEDRALPPIVVDWKPNRRLVGAVKVAGRGNQRALVFETLPAANNTDVRDSLQIPIGQKIDQNSISALTRATVHSMLRRNDSILVLCRGKATAVTRATEIAEELPLLETTSEQLAICRYLEAEIGRKSSLIECLRKGVTYHHAGLSQEARLLIEGLIRRKQVKVVCGTTTLAQGVNFPITTVIVETLKKGNNDLTYQDFWNIAGRAGRTLVDSVGIIAFPAPDAKKLREYTSFLQGEALEISSQLAELIQRADEIAEKFDINTLLNFPQLSPLLQFLAHAMRVSGSDNVADEVEDLLRASLVYHQAQRQGAEASQRLVQLCRSYLNQIRGNPGILTLADQTGFATPSVKKLLQQTRGDTEFTEPVNWHPERLFSDDLEPLTKRVEAIAHLPEIQLGQNSSQNFNAERIAAILRDWVQGETLDSLTQKYSVSDSEDPDKRISEFSQYLFSELIGRASWGIGALEGVSLANNIPESEWEKIGYVPSMIFFGVKRKEAIWLRMVGVPRVVADSLAQLWQQKKTKEPETYDDIRTWVTQLTNDEWQQTIPSGTSLTPDDMRFIWNNCI